MANGNGNGTRIEAIANNAVITVASRIILPLMLTTFVALLGWEGQRLVTQLDKQDDRLSHVEAVENFVHGLSSHLITMENAASTAATAAGDAKTQAAAAKTTIDDVKTKVDARDSEFTNLDQHLHQIDITLQKHDDKLDALGDKIDGIIRDQSTTNNQSPRVIPGK